MSRQRELVIVRIGNECTRIEEMMGIASEPSPGQLAVAIDGAKNVRDMLQETYYFDRVSMNRLANSLNGFLRILERPQNKNYFAVANEFKVTIDEIIRDEMLTTE